MTTLRRRPTLSLYQAYIYVQLMIMIMRLSTQAHGSNKEKWKIKFHANKKNCRARVATVSSQATGVTVTMALLNKDGTPNFELPNEEEQDKTSTNLPPVKVESKVTRLSSSLNSSVASPSKSSTSYLKSDKWKCKECTYASNSEIEAESDDHGFMEKKFHKFKTSSESQPFINKRYKIKT